MAIAVATIATHVAGMAKRLSPGASPAMFYTKSTKGRVSSFMKTANCLRSGPLPP